MDELELIVKDLWNDNKLMLGGKVILTEYIRKEREKQCDIPIVSVSDDEIMKTAVYKISNNNYTWNFDYGVDMANWMRDKLNKH